MLHGWSGDETVMWVLQSVLPDGAFIVAARGTHKLATGGYHWSDSPASTQVSFVDFQPAVEAIKTTLSGLRSSDGFGLNPLLLMGFSQGAALAFAAVQAGIEVEGIISLAGFVPRGDLTVFRELPVFWGHGTLDELVPIERAREDVKRLLDAVAQVHFCETEVGHKLGIECTRGLKTWLRGHFSPDRKEPGVKRVQ
jgi:phospholipase/carboxylesterase